MRQITANGPISRRDAVDIADGLCSSAGENVKPFAVRRFFETIKEILGAIGQEIDKVPSEASDQKFGDGTLWTVQTLRTLADSARKAHATPTLHLLQDQLRPEEKIPDIDAVVAHAKALWASGASSEARKALADAALAIGIGAIVGYAGTHVVQHRRGAVGTFAAGLALGLDGQRLWSDFQRASLLGEYVDLLPSTGPLRKWIERIYSGDWDIDMSERIGNPFWHPKPEAVVAHLPQGFEYHPEALRLPVLWGYGEVPSTWEVLSWNETLRGQAMRLLDLTVQGEIEVFVPSFREFLFCWAGVSRIRSGSRGPNIDARILAFFERTHAEAFSYQRQRRFWSNRNPDAEVGRTLSRAFDDWAEKLAGRFLAQSAGAYAHMNSSDVHAFREAFTTHPLSSIATLAHNNGPSDRRLEGHLGPALVGLTTAVESRRIGHRAAAQTLTLCRHDLTAEIGFNRRALDLATMAGPQVVERAGRYFVAPVREELQEIITSSTANPSWRTEEGNLLWGQALKRVHGASAYLFMLELIANSSGARVAHEIVDEIAGLLSPWT